MADGSPRLTIPYTVIVDDIIVGVVRSDTAAGKLGSIDVAMIKKVEIVPESRARERWPSAVGDVVHIDRCHEPTQRTTIH
jgi:hypothetical protein